MKKYSILLAIILIFSSCNLSQPKEIVYEIPDFPVFIEQKEFWNRVASIDRTARPAESNFVKYNDKHIILYNFPLFGTKAKRVIFEFSHSYFLTRVKAHFDKAENESLKQHLLSLYGEPVKTHKETYIRHFASHSKTNVPIVGDKNLAIEGLYYIWHAEEPISKAWTPEEMQFFRQSFCDKFIKAGRNPITDESEWQTYFENTWDRIIYAGFAPEERKAYTEIRIEAIPKDPSMWFANE